MHSSREGQCVIVNGSKKNFNFLQNIIFYLETKGGQSFDININIQCRVGLNLNVNLCTGREQLMHPEMRQSVRKKGTFRMERKSGSR
jgi:hypothetical protein